MFDAANENDGYPVLVFGNTAAGEAFTARAPPPHRGPQPLGGRGASSPPTSPARLPPRSRGRQRPHRPVRAFLLHPGVPAGSDSPDPAAYPYPQLQSAVLDLGAGGSPKGAAIVLAYRSGTKTGESYDRAYAKYVAAEPRGGRQGLLTSFTPMTGGSLALADLLRVAKQQLVVYVDYSGVAFADNAPIPAR